MTNKKLRVALKAFPRTKRNEHLLSTEDIALMPNSDLPQPTPPLTMFEYKGKTYVVRTEGTVNSFGLGKVVAPGVATFAPFFYNMTRNELKAKIEGLR